MDEQIGFVVEQGVLVRYTGTETRITIPAGVTEIAENAFAFHAAIETVCLPDSVTQIGAHAFEGCSNLRQIQLPEGLRSIGEGAFMDCAALWEIPLPMGLQKLGECAFAGCGMLQAITIPEGVAQIPASLCECCDSLVSAMILHPAPTIGSCAFGDCPSLRQLHVAADVQIPQAALSGSGQVAVMPLPADDAAPSVETPMGKVRSSDFVIENGVLLGYQGNDEEVTVPDGVVRIAEGAFTYNPYVTRLVLPPSVAYIEKMAFSLANNLEEIALYQQTELSDYALAACAARLRYRDGQAPQFIMHDGTLIHYNGTACSVIIPEDVKVIGLSAFQYNNMITDVTIPATVEEIEPYSFTACTKLREIRYCGTTRHTMDSFSFCGAKLRNLDENCSGDFLIEDGVLLRYNGEEADVIVPAGVTMIGGGAFLGNRDLETVVLPDTVQHIHETAFMNCMMLRSVTLPASVTEIGRCAFQGCRSLVRMVLPPRLACIDESCFDACESLTEVSIPSSVTEIGNRAFSGCSQLREILIPPTVKVLGCDVFSKCYNLRNIAISVHALYARESFRDCSSGIWYADDPREFIVEDGILTRYMGGNTMVMIPDHVTAIAKHAFKGCWMVQEVYIPDTVKRLDTEIFVGCKILRTIHLSQKIAFTDLSFVGTSCRICYLDGETADFLVRDGVLIRYNGEATDVVIPETVNIIGNCAFLGNRDMQSVVIPETVTEIRNLTFFECAALTEITVPESVKQVGEGAFARCEQLQCLTILATDIQVSDAICLEDKNLRQVQLAAAITLPETTFQGIPTEVQIIYMDGGQPDMEMMEEEQEMEECCFEKHVAETETCSMQITDGVLISYTGNQTCVTIPEGVVTIGANAFSEAPLITKLTLPASLRSIEEAGLASLDQLTEIVLPEQLDAVGENAFFMDDALTEVVLPDTLTTLGNEAFAYCNGLKKLHLPVTLQKIPDRLAIRCQSLQEIDLPVNLRIIGDAAFSRCFALEHVTFHEGLEVIGELAFASCSSLTKLTLPDSLTCIAENAFASCIRLQEVSLSAKTTVAEGAFRNCPDVQIHLRGEVSPFRIVDGVLMEYTGDALDVVVPDGVTEIGARAFAYFTKLESVTLPDSCLRIGAKAFEDCENLDAISLLPETRIALDALDGCPAALRYRVAETPDCEVQDGVLLRYTGEANEWQIPNGVVEIAEEAFADCETLQTLVCPDTLLVIHDRAFVGCTCLHTLQLNQGLAEIGSYVVADCDQLNSLTLPDSLQVVKKNAFRRCPHLKKLHLSRDMELPDEALDGCMAVLYYYDLDPADASDFQIKDGVLLNYLGLAQHVVIPAGVRIIDTQAFYNAEQVLTVAIPDTVTRIEPNAFEGCTGISRLILPEKLQRIGLRAFYGCSGLKQIVIPESVQFIGEYAFAECYQLAAVKLPAGLKSIEHGLFMNCMSLPSVTIPVGIPVIGKEAFSGCDNLEELRLSRRTMCLAASTRGCDPRLVYID